MNRQENILNHLAEECNEVGQRVSKALRFGLGEIQDGQPLDNAERILDELHDLISVAYILQEEGVLGDINPTPARIDAKRAKIEKYLEYSRQCGTLTADPKPVQVSTNDEKCEECEKGYMRPAAGGGIKCDSCPNWFCF